MQIQEQIRKSIELAEAKALFGKLEAVYGQIPSGECAGCTQCCSESVSVFYVEFLYVYHWLLKRPELLASLEPRIKAYWMNEMIQRMSCPFLDDGGKCTIYPVRPLVCRQFGHWTRKDFDANMQMVRESNRETAAYYLEHYDMVLPEAVVEAGLPYCEAFQVSKKMSTQKRLGQSDTIFMLDVAFLQTGLLEEEQLGIPLISWFMGLQGDLDKLGQDRVAFMEEALLNRK